MKKFHIFILFASIAFLSESVMAQSHPRLSKQFDNCMKKTEDAKWAMISCTSEEFERQDARLNAAYKTLLKQFGPNSKKQLQEAQRAWIRFRDTNCLFHQDLEGSTNPPANANYCAMTMTASRAEELERFIF